MKKLALKLDDLQVESFSTVATPRVTGTVRGHDTADGQSCWCGTDTTASPSDLVGGCSVFNTCIDGCGGSNPNSGWNTCGDGSECTLGYTEWGTCTQNYKHCGP